jgi:arylsulfatase A-like enzyme
LDEQIGRIVHELERNDLARHTIVIFASDHGLALGSHGLLGKQNLFEHSVRAPLLLSGPGIPRNQQTRAMVYLHDLFPTVCDLVNIPVPDDLDGRSFAPVVQNPQRTESREAIFCAYRDVQRSIRDRRWKLIYYPRLGKLQLFDLQTDPFEKQNLVTKKNLAPKIRELQARLRDHQLALGDPMLKSKL